MTINSIFLDTFFSYEYGLDMKREGKRPNSKQPIEDLKNDVSIRNCGAGKAGARYEAGCEGY